METTLSAQRWLCVKLCFSFFPPQQQTIRNEKLKSKFITSLSILERIGKMVCSNHMCSSCMAHRLALNSITEHKTHTHTYSHSHMMDTCIHDVLVFEVFEEAVSCVRTRTQPQSQHFKPGKIRKLKHSCLRCVFSLQSNLAVNCPNCFTIPCISVWYLLGWQRKWEHCRRRNSSGYFCHV